MKYTFFVCDAAADQELMSVLENVSVGKKPELTYTTRPSYFAYLAEVSVDSLVIGVRSPEGELVGFGTVSVQERMWRGKKIRVGYLEHLRLRGEHRGQGLLSQAFTHLKQEKGRLRVDFFYTSLVAGNKQAEAILTRERKDYPRLTPMSEVETKLFVPRARRASLQVKRDRKAGINYVKKNCAEMDFFPTGLTEKNLDWFVAYRRNTVVGACAVWNQQSSKQVNIVNWGFPLTLLIRAFNLKAAITKSPKLPLCGELPIAFLTQVVVENTAVFEDLLATVETEYRCKVPFLIAGFATSDPLLKAFGARRCITYKSKLYKAEWEPTQTEVPKSLYPEVALL